MAAKNDANRFLRNYIKQAGTHNRVQEEREMWRQRSLEIQSQIEPRLERTHHTRKRSPVTRGRLLSDTLDEQTSTTSTSKRRRDIIDEPPLPMSSYWTRQLMKAEETDTHRWGHSGYKELYPEEFISTDDDIDKSTDDRETDRGRKHKSKLSKRKERKRRHKQSKKKIRLSTSTTSSGNTDTEMDEIRKRRKKKRKKEQKEK